MWSKMLLLSLNIYILLSIVDGKGSNPSNTPLQAPIHVKKNTSDTGSIVFPAVTMNPKCKDQIMSVPLQLINNDTQTMKEIVDTEVRIQNTTTSELNQMLIIGLLNATLNIDRAIDGLYSHIPDQGKNIIVSPICLAAAMSIVLLGANGKTKTEVGKLFGLNEDTLRMIANNNNQQFKDLGRLINYFQLNTGDNVGTKVNLAKAIFVQNGYSIKDDFKSTIKDYLNSELVEVNFESDGERAQKTVNQWVSKMTEGKINDIMPDIPLPETKTVIASALYFIGEWENPFSTRYTRPKPFYKSSSDKKSNKDNCVYVPMMVGNGEVYFHKNDELDFKSIGLPYKGKKFVTYFVLPNSNVSLREIVAKMDGNTIKNITKNPKVTEITYFVPKMTLKSSTNLRPILQKLGMKDMFDPSKANFTNMSPINGSYISEILHQVEIDINEFGTVAAAATVITVTRGGQAIFNVNKPFIFFIHHTESDTVVFWSTVYEPTPHLTTPPNPK